MYHLSLSDASYDVITVGVYTSCSQKYKHGGLRRLMQHLESCSTPPPANSAFGNAPNSSTVASRVTALASTLSRLTVLRKAVDAACDAMCEAAIAGDLPSVATAKTQLVDKVKMLE